MHGRFFKLVIYSFCFMPKWPKLPNLPLLWQALVPLRTLGDMHTGVGEGVRSDSKHHGDLDEDHQL